MSFEAESRKIGDMDWVVGGVDFTSAPKIDTILALMEDTVIAIPDVSILTIFHDRLASCATALELQEEILTLANSLTEAAHIAQSMANTDWRKMSSVEMFAQMAAASGVQMTQGSGLLYLLIHSAQMGDKFVMDWTRSKLSSLPVYNVLLQSSAITQTTSLDTDLDHLSDLCTVRVVLALLTRWQSVAARFSSALGPQDMLQRASVLSRLATMFHLIRVGPTVAQTLTLWTLLTSPILERDMQIRFNALGMKMIQERVDQVRQIDLNDVTAYVGQAFGDPVKGEHLGNAVTVTRLPRGMWRAILGSSFLTNQIAGSEDTRYTPIGGVADPKHVTAIDSDTTVWPQLDPNGLPSLASWESVMHMQRDTLYLALEQRLTMLEQDVALSHARRNVTQTKEVIDCLRPHGHAVNPFVPCSSTDLTPAIYGINKAEIDIASVGDLMRTALIPDSVEAAYSGRSFDSRDIARYVRARTAGLRKRMSILASAQGRLDGAIADHVILHLPLSAAYKFWPTVIPLNLMEMCPPAYAGGAMTHVFVQDADGLAKCNGTSLHRFRETMRANLNQATDKPGSILAVIYGLMRIGVITHHTQAPSAAESLATLNILRGNSSLTVTGIQQGLEGQMSLTAGAKIKGIPGLDHIWGIRIAVALSKLLEETTKGIDLTGDGTWQLWPFTAMPMPADITRFQNGRTPPYSRPAGATVEETDALPLESFSRELMNIDDAPTAQRLTWIKNNGWARIEGRDMRTLHVASYPAGIYAGSPYVVGFKVSMDATRLRLVPQRADIVDALLWAPEIMYSAEKQVTLRGRPSGKVITLPDTARIALISSVLGEAREL